MSWTPSRTRGAPAQRWIKDASALLGAGAASSTRLPRIGRDHREGPGHPRAPSRPSPPRRPRAVRLRLPGPPAPRREELQGGTSSCGSSTRTACPEPRPRPLAGGRGQRRAALTLRAALTCAMGGEMHARKIRALLLLAAAALPRDRGPQDAPPLPAGRRRRRSSPRARRCARRWTPRPLEFESPVCAGSARPRR